MNHFIAPTKGAARPLAELRRFLWSFFSLFTLVWVLLPLAANQTLNRDTIQILYWGREGQWGYFKHPPLISWIAEALYRLSGPHDAVFYLASLIIVLAAFLAIHRLASAFLAPWPAAMAVTSLTVLGFYSYLVPNLNHNILVLLPWAMILLTTYRAMEERRRSAWLWLGLWFGIGILTKYTVLMLSPLILAHMLAEPRHRRLVLHPGPWLAMAIGLLVSGPHLIWLAQNEFMPLFYIQSGAGIAEPISAQDHLINPLISLGKMLGMGAPAVGLLWLSLGRPRWQGHGHSSADRFLLTMGLGPPGLVLVLSAVSGAEMRNEWAMPFFLILPILLMRHGFAVPDPAHIRRFLVGLTSLSVAMAVTYLLIFSGVISVSEEEEWAQFPARDAAAAMERGWSDACGAKPLPIIVGDSWLAGTASYLLPGQPRVYTEADSRMAPWVTDRMVGESGALIVWNKDRPAQFRDLDHQDEDENEEPRDWFPGLPALAARFGPITALHDAVLPYGGIVPQPPVHLGLAVVCPR